MRPVSSSRELNGSRPARLKMNKESHSIHKSSSSSSSSSCIPSSSDQRPPVIIYTHSPKIIHTEARDFMALVQKLTGMSSVDHSNVAAAHEGGGGGGGVVMNTSVDMVTDSYNTNLDFQNQCSSICSNSLSPSDSLSPPDQTFPTTLSPEPPPPPGLAVDMKPEYPMDFFFPDRTCFMYEEMPAEWINPTFASGNQEDLF